MPHEDLNGVKDLNGVMSEDLNGVDLNGGSQWGHVVNCEFFPLKSIDPVGLTDHIVMLATTLSHRAEPDVSPIRGEHRRHDIVVDLTGVTISMGSCREL